MVFLIAEIVKIVMVESKTVGEGNQRKKQSARDKRFTFKQNNNLKHLKPKLHWSGSKPKSLIVLE